MHGWPCATFSPCALQLLSCMANGRRAVCAKQERWKLHPEAIVTHRFPLSQAGEAYRLAAEGLCGKVVILPNGE